MLTLLRDLGVKVINLENGFFSNWMFWIMIKVLKTHIILTHGWIPLILALWLDIGAKFYQELPSFR